MQKLLLFRWSFWYVYSMSHHDKKKIKQMRRNDYELREVYSFDTVSIDSNPDFENVSTDWGLLAYVQQPL